MHSLHSFIVLVTLAYSVTAQVDPDLARLCSSATRCNECIIANSECIWCADPAFNSTSQCYARMDTSFACNPAFLQDPEGSTTNGATPPLGGTIQVSPMEINVAVRPGAPISFPLTVQPARNFPVDVYLLMDLSASMSDDLENLKRLGSSVAAEIADISSDFRVGFGSFVEKRVSPFVSLNVARQLDPCNGGCVSTYSYRHHVDLTMDSQAFDDEVDRQTISGNQDSPEGGFDGFLQSIVCTNLIGWRNISRKLIIFITDAGFHIAGDGKLGGVVMPNDGRCRVSGEAPQDYNDWITLDYPSIGQIAEALRASEIIPIFTAQMSALPAYQSLVRELGEGAFSGTLDRDSGNIVDLLRESYNNVSQRIVFDRQQVPAGVSVDVQISNCPGPIVAGVCTGVLIENNATFDVMVTLQECTPENSGTVQVPIRVVGFGTFTISLSTICACDCDTNTVMNSPACNNNGTLGCGRCDCNAGRFGDVCQCDATGQGGMNMMCPLGPTEVQCTSTDRGTCVCGECQCRRDQAGPLFFGPACECDRDGCPSFNGELCSARGECTCTGCRCNVEPNTQLLFYGDACECSPDTDCVDPNNSTDMCNGRGTCGCSGQCECQDPYLGTYCEFCSGDDICLEQTCSVHQGCAQCAVNLFNQAPMSNTELLTIDSLESFLPNGTSLEYDASSNTFQVRLPSGFCPEDLSCSENVVVINGTDDVDYLIENQMTIRCEYVDECTYRYYVGVNEETLEFTDVHVEFRRFCPQPVAVTAPWIIAVAIIAVLLVAAVVALILLRVLLYVIDRIDAYRFEKELARIEYSKNTNPLYRSATKDYMNPTYGQ